MLKRQTATPSSWRIVAGPCGDFSVAYGMPHEMRSRPEASRATLERKNGRKSRPVKP